LHGTDKYQNLQSPPKDSTLTPETVFALRRKLIETRKLNAALLVEKTRNDAQIARLRSLLQPATAPKREPRTSTSPAKVSDQSTNGSAPFAFLTHTAAAQSLGIQALPQNAATTTTSTPLTTHTSFTTSQLPYLRQLLDSLKPHLATTALPTNTNGKAGEKEELNRERKVYVESQSKRILERRGVDTRDGVEGVWEGSRVRAEEVRGLEGLVEVMERGKERRDVKMEGVAEEVEHAGDGDAMDTS
jgi:kinetochore protein Mis12/MTW1